MENRLSLEEARSFGSQEGNCRRLGKTHRGEIWHCSSCDKDIPGESIILDIDADAHACPRCKCWDCLYWRKA